VRLFIRSRCKREILSMEDLDPRLNPNDSVSYITFMKCCINYLNAKVSTRASKIFNCTVILFDRMDMAHSTRRELGQGKVFVTDGTTLVSDHHDHLYLPRKRRALIGMDAWGRRCWTETPCVLFNQERERDLFFPPRASQIRRQLSLAGRCPIIGLC
jgi:hypothetical protein